MRQTNCYSQPKLALRLRRFSAGLLLTVMSAPWASAGEVRLVLHETATVGADQVRLKDICRIQGADRQQLAKISNLVIAEILDPAQPEVISSQYVRLRTALKGIPLDDVRMLGANEVEVQYQSPQLLNDAEIELKAHEAVRSMLGVAADDVEVVLLTPFVRQLPQSIRDQPDLRIQVLKPNGKTVGRMQLQVRVWDRTDIVSTRNADVLVRRRFDIAVAQVSLMPNQPISESDVVFESRFLDFDADSPREDQILGKSVRSAKRAGTILSLRDMATPARSRMEIAVRRREPVTVTVRRGAVVVKMQGVEAQQQGRIGDLIQLRNPITRVSMSGVITGNGEVELR
jgi:flagella basal body P-ring formation protein FlgA